MSAEANKATVRRYFEEFINRGNMAAAETMAHGFVFHDPILPAPLQGRDAFVQFVGSLRAAFPDMSFTVEDLIAENDKATVRWTLRGTHQGEFAGVPATGRSVEIAGIDLFHLKDGRLSEGWVEADTMGLMQQLGVMPAPAG